MWSSFILRFVLGLALGSFLHVLASRYNERRFILDRGTVSGRSFCPHCKKKLAWYELVPLVSFLIQRGRCRSCGAVIGWSYFWVEVISGLVVAYAPLALQAHSIEASIATVVLWTVLLLVLLLMSLIDMRLQIIPDELTIAIGILGLGRILIDPLASSWVNHLVAALGVTAFFAFLALITRGRGMGMGDVKLVFALGLLFGWPDIILLTVLAFVIGAVAGLVLIAADRKKLKSAVPFGPFLAVSAGVVFFWGQAIIQNWYNLII